MAYLRALVRGALLLGVAINVAQAADQSADNSTKTALDGASSKPAKAPPLKAKPIPEVPFFFINDNRITYSFANIPAAGYTKKTPVSTVAFTHFDAWAYGTNAIAIGYMRAGRSAPTLPCFGDVTAPLGSCAGATLMQASVRSTVGWNQLFDTRMFSVGPLTNISFLAGYDGSTSNIGAATANSGVVAGLQFAFALPYKGYFNISPLYSQEWAYGGTSLPASVAGAVAVQPPYTGFPDGRPHYSPTWMIDVNYYMDLGFLPENLQYFAISGRGFIRGPKGNGDYGPYVNNPKSSRITEYTVEPIRLTLDASRLFWGQKYAHLIDTWVAWRYSQNTDGRNMDMASDCIVAVTKAYNGSCSVNTWYAGITMKLGADIPGTPALSSFGLPFFKSVDNRLAFGILPDATSPGQTAATQKQAYTFIHNDTWAYGTNSLVVDMLKSDHRDPITPCTAVFNNPAFGASAPCAGALEFDGSLRSTLGWNEVFNTRAFAMGPLKNISFEAGADVRTVNSYWSPSKLAAVAGLQFGFGLPYGGHLNIAPLYYQEWNHSSFAYPNNAGNSPLGFGIYGPTPYSGTMPAGFSGTPDGNLHYAPTWAFEADYAMELGFLPESLRFLSISGRAGIYGPKGNGAYGSYTVPSTMNTATEINAEPIRLTFDVSKALWGAQYSHYVDTFVAYRYWKNKFGLDDSNSKNNVCFFANGTNNKSCTEQTLYAGVILKF